MPGREQCSRSLEPRSCCFLSRPRHTRRTRRRSRLPARCSRSSAARATGRRTVRRPISPTTAATTSGRARSRCLRASYEYKAPLNDAWTENYGFHAQPDGANVPLSRPFGRERQVLLRPQEPLGHRQQGLGDRGRARELPVRARLPGRLGSRLPPLLAPGHGRQRHLLVRDDARCRGLVRGEGGDQRGLGRELRPGRRPGRGKHPVHRPGRQREGHVHLRRDVARSHDRRREPAGRPGRPRRAVALRPRAQGLPRHRPQHDLEGLVHGRERRPERRLLPDGRQHERRDPPVRRHRRLDVHRPANARHDLRGRGGSRQRRHGLQGHGDARRTASTGSNRGTSPIPTGTRC